MGFVIPAVDIQNGTCVRLTKGELDKKTVYYKNPIDALDFWFKEGATKIHIVDLDGAFGIGSNFNLIEEMVNRYKSIDIQVGGGIRDLYTAKKFIELGVKRIIVGTAAIKNPNFIKELQNDIGNEALIIDLAMTKDEKPAIKGWTETINENVFEYAKILEEKGAGAILFTPIAGDGAFTGPDIKNTKKMVETVNIPVIAAGGIRNKEDIFELNKIGVKEVIIGKAFYEKRIIFSDIKNI
ncbi:MAG: 1-(5-phosphoribosyl)-5-[(5-phosphoribosylamino)methylideneamino]imidazole-4-carboxamide isomerase [archaeon]|nr:1-(5-phosphoribosyl)-5-[(5-phosphoribosylamino)methylideneamino]imidazole-4-carboxamide isomerase [archaeon]